MLLGKGLLRGKTLSPRVFHLVHWPGRRRLSAQGSPTHCREVSWPAFDFCRLSTYLCSVYLCSVFCAYLCSVYLCSVFCACVCTTQLCRPVLSGPVEEPKGLVLRPAALGDVLVAGRDHVSVAIGLFGAPPLSEGYVVLREIFAFGFRPKPRSEIVCPLCVSKLRRICVWCICLYSSLNLVPWGSK